MAPPLLYSSLWYDPRPSLDLTLRHGLCGGRLSLAANTAAVAHVYYKKVFHLNYFLVHMILQHLELLLVLLLHLTVKLNYQI